jgi:hypothetical protein
VEVGSATRSVYNKVHERVSASDALGSESLTSFDERGRPTVVYQRRKDCHVRNGEIVEARGFSSTAVSSF